MFECACISSHLPPNNRTSLSKLHKSSLFTPYSITMPIKTLDSVLADAVSRYTASNQTSKALHTKATETLPGGNTRTVLHANPFPLYIKSAKGYQVTSEDDKTYTDLTCEFTAALYGHSNPLILSSIQSVLQTVGINLSATTAQETLFAQSLCARFHLDRVRFTNSGTEANLHALTAARLFTGKRKVVAFGGAYHGGVLSFARGEPALNNVDRDDWIVAAYNDIESAREAIRSDGVAAVIMDGMQGSSGCIPATLEFLKAVQDVAKESGVLFILDEVMTSRTSTNGLAIMHNLTPDLKTLGKYLGGGLTFGAFGGRADIMAVFDPRLDTSVAHSGTFNNNSLVIHAGYIGLTQIYTPEVAERFTQLGETLRFRLNEVTSGTCIFFSGVGTIMAVHARADGVREIVTSVGLQQIQGIKDLFWFEMLEEGFWIAKRGFMSLILDTPESELDRFVDAVQRFVERHRELVTV